MQALHYKDVVLVPNYSDLNSRSQADTMTELAGFQFKAPIVPSNMKCTINISTARSLANNGYFYIMHRFDMDTVEFVRIANYEGWKLVSISIGVNDIDIAILEQLYACDYRIDFITVDIAHGHHKKMAIMLSHLQQFRERGTKIIAGNIVTNEAAYDLIKWGADIVKVGKIGRAHV